MPLQSRRRKFAIQILRSARVLLSNAVQYNISPLYTQYEQCACVTKERTSPSRMFLDSWTPALPSCYINQAITSRTKITGCQENWHRQQMWVPLNSNFVQREMSIMWRPLQRCKNQSSFYPTQLYHFSWMVHMLQIHHTALWLVTSNLTTNNIIGVTTANCDWRDVMVPDCSDVTPQDEET
jgi:hypothetical protein